MLELGNVFILGDSYSTFKGHIPEGYHPYYSSDSEGGDVDSVEKTWWHQLVSENNAVLLMNNSWSGTTVCHTGYNGEDRNDNSFVARTDKLISEGYFKKNKIDTFLLFGGTNDSWADSPLGEIMYEGWQEKDLYNVLPAFCYLIHTLKKNLPDTRIVCIINSELKKEITEGFFEVCRKNNVDCVLLGNIDKVDGHPTFKGMTEIKEAVAVCLAGETK